MLISRHLLYIAIFLLRIPDFLDATKWSLSFFPCLPSFLFLFSLLYKFWFSQTYLLFNGKVFFLYRMTNILCEVEYYVFFLTRAQLELTIIYFINIYSERFPKVSEKICMFLAIYWSVPNSVWYYICARYTPGRCFMSWWEERV